MATEIFRQIGFDASEAIAQLNALGAAVNSAGNLLSRFDRSSAFSGGGKFAQGLSQAKSQMVQFSDGSKRAVSSLDDLVRGAQSAAAGLPQLDNNLKRVNNTAKQGSSTLSRFGKTVGNILAVRAIIGSLGALSSALRSTTNEAREFGLAIAEVQTIARSLNSTNEALSSRVLELSSALGTDAIDTARGLYQVLSNQVVEASESFQFLEQAQKLAITTVASTTEAVDALSSVMNAYGLEAADAARVSDTLFEAVNVGRFTLDEIANIIGRVTPLTAQMGISWEETAAAISTMTQSGVRADTAVTQLRAVVIKLLKPTEAMTELFQKWGVKDGPSAIAAFGGLQGVLQKLSQETSGSTTEMTKFFNEVRGLAGALGLNIDNAERFATVLGQIENSAGAARRAFEGFQASQAQQLTIEMNKLKNAVIDLGTALQPVAIFFSKVLANNVKFATEIVKETRNALNEGAALADRNAERIKKTQKENEDAQREFTGFTSREYKVREQAFLASLTVQQKAFDRYASQVERRQEVITDKLRGYGRDLSSAFGDALNSLEKRVESFSDRINDSLNKIQDIQFDIDDEKLRQSLDNAFNPRQRQQILNTDAEAKTIEALNALRSAGSEEELKAAEALAKRAISAQRARESAAGELKDTFSKRDAQSDILKLLEAEKKANEDALKRQVDQRDQEVAKLDELKRKEDELKTLVKQRDDAIKDVINTRGLERDAALQTLEAIDQKIKQLGFDKGTFDLFKTFDGEGAINSFNKILTELDTARVDWSDAVANLERQLSGLRVKVQLETEAGQAQAFAEALGVQFDPNDLVGTARGVTEESKQILKDEATLRQEIAAAQKIEGALQDNITDSVTTLNNVLGNAVQRQLTSSQQAQLLATRLTSGKDAAKELFDQFARDFPELNALPGNLQGILDQLKAGNLTGAQEGIGNLKGSVDQLRDSGKLSKEEYDALNEFLGTVLPQTIANLQTQTAGLRDRLAELAPKIEVANQWQNIVDRVGGAEARARGLLQSTNALPGAANGAAGGIRVISDEFLKSQGFSANTVNNTNSIGQAAAAQIGNVNALTGAMQELAAAAQQAAAAQAAAQGGGGAPGARFGRYFARGGLAALKPMGTDTIPAMIQRGEFVTNARSSRKFFSELNAINQDRQPVRRREGGSVTNVGDVNVTVQGGDTSRQTVRAIAAELTRELKRGTIRLGTLRKA